MATSSLTENYCYCFECFPRRLWKRRTVLSHLEVLKSIIKIPQGFTLEFREKVQECIKRTADSLAGNPPALDSFETNDRTSPMALPSDRLEDGSPTNISTSGEPSWARTSDQDHPMCEASPQYDTLPAAPATEPDPEHDESEDDISDCSDRVQIDLDSDLLSSESSDESYSDTHSETGSMHSSGDPDHSMLPTSPGCDTTGVPSVDTNQLSTEHCSDIDESDFIQSTTPGLDKLKADLRGDYKQGQAPLNTFTIPGLNDQQKLSLQHYTAWQKSSGTVKAYQLHALVLQNTTGVEILSLYRAKKLATQLSRLTPRKVDMCPQSCIAYTGKYKDLESCPYISSSSRVPCNSPRYKKSRSGTRRVPYAHLTVLPIMATIQALYANVDSARLLRQRDQTLQQVLSMVASATNAGTSPQRSYSDFADSQIHTDIHYKTLGLFKDKRDVAFALSTDGAQLTMKKHSNTWLMILILLNLPPELRYHSSNVIINFATPGPNSPGDIESFIQPLFEEMAQASEGIWIWDAIDSSYFVFRAWIVLGLGDMLGSAKINGMAGHSAIYGDRFSLVEAAKASDAKGAKAQYYTITKGDRFNSNRHLYSFDNIPMRTYEQYFEVLNRLEAAKSETERKTITKKTGIVRLPLCAASSAFFHPTFFPLDPFHLFYENCMAFIWDLWTIPNRSIPGELFRLSEEKVAKVGSLVASAMSTLPPAFCGPVRNPHLKRQSQYKIYEWMALLHWYLIPIGIELWFNSVVLENFSHFVKLIEFAMTTTGRTEDELWALRNQIVVFLTGFEKIYIGDNPANNHRARLCIFQLIHIPIHIQWNGSIRLGSQATVERSIGEMAHKIRSRKSPFSNLTNIIIQREQIRLILLYYPDLELSKTGLNISRNRSGAIGGACKVPLTQKEYSNPSSDTYKQLVALFDQLGIPGSEVELGQVRRFGKVRLLNDKVLQSQIYYQLRPASRRYCWFWGLDRNKSQTFGCAQAFYEVSINDRTSYYAVYNALEGVESTMGTIRGKKWSEAISVIDVARILDIVGIWDACSMIYILRKHPGLAMLNEEECEQEDEDDDV